MKNMLLSEKQLSQVDSQIKRLIKTDSFYGKKYREMGITGCKNQDDFDRIPFSCKDDLRFAYPLGIQAVDDSEVVRIHSSSGRYRMRRWYESILRPERQVSRSSFLIQQRMWMTGRLCLHAAMKQQALLRQTEFISLQATVCGLQVSVFKQDVKS